MDIIEAIEDKNLFASWFTDNSKPPVYKAAQQQPKTGGGGREIGHRVSFNYLPRMRDEKSEIQKIKKFLLSSNHYAPFAHDYAHAREAQLSKLDVRFTPENGSRKTPMA